MTPGSRTSRVGILAGLAVCLGSCAIFDTSPRALDPGCRAPAVTGGTRALEVSLRHEGYDRSYVLHVPPALNPGQPHPLLLSFHGAGSGALDQADLSELNVTADARRFLVAYPEGLFGSWNAGTCCGRAAADAIDDVGFVRAVVADLRTKVCIDPDRIYATGMASGATFTHRLACDAADLIAAAAPVAGSLELASCDPARPIPILMIQGTDDELSDPARAAESRALWERVQGCRPAATRTEGRCELNETCRGGSTVGFCRLDGFAHCWPGNASCPFGRATSPLDFSANVEMWRFFELATQN